ncbi:hypothetical protein BC827DRAFT_1170383 [Russula dissimulans]|nr:hypothetical protein BC827DRAFT_1170383 [Russula dissimulans]
MAPTAQGQNRVNHNVEWVSKSYASFGDKFTTIMIKDLATLDLSPAVKGVDAIIHIASPLLNSSTPQLILNTAIRRRLCSQSSSRCRREAAATAPNPLLMAHIPSTYFIL